LHQREQKDLPRIGAMRYALQYQCDGLLAFAGVLDDKLDAIAQYSSFIVSLARNMCAALQARHVEPVLARLEPAVSRHGQFAAQQLAGRKYQLAAAQLSHAAAPS
jgi:hypothetical protein